MFTLSVGLNPFYFRAAAEREGQDEVIAYYASQSLLLQGCC